MSKRKELDEITDELRVGVTIHPDALEKYAKCRQCPYDSNCRSCGMNEDGEIDVMAQFLRPRPMLPFNL